MPSDTEINEQKSAFPALRVWGTWPSGMVEEVRWGDIAVVPFYDHVDAIKAAEQRVTDRHNAEHEDDRLAAFESGYATGLAEVRDAVASMVTERELRSPSGCDVDIHDVLARIDQLAQRQVSE